MMETGETLSLMEDVTVEEIPTETNEETTKQSEADLEERPSDDSESSSSDDDEKDDIEGRQEVDDEADLEDKHEVEDKAEVEDQKEVEKKEDCEDKQEVEDREDVEDKEDVEEEQEFEEDEQSANKQLAEDKQEVETKEEVEVEDDVQDKEEVEGKGDVEVKEEIETEENVDDKQEFESEEDVDNKQEIEAEENVNKDEYKREGENKVDVGAEKAVEPEGDVQYKQEVNNVEENQNVEDDEELADKEVEEDKQVVEVDEEIAAKEAVEKEIADKPQPPAVKAVEEKQQLEDDNITEETQLEHVKDETVSLPEEEGATEPNTIVNDTTNDHNDTTNDGTAADGDEDEEDDDESNQESKEEDDLQIPKLNGNHSLSMHDEDSSSSSTSSASSHNLVIDHPLAEKSPQRPPAEVMDTGFLDGKSLKRKLSPCENGSPRYKQIHLDNDSLDTLQEPNTRSIEDEVMPEAPLACESSREEQETVSRSPRETSLATVAPTIETRKPSSPNPFEQYAAMLANSLPSPKLKFECYRCKKCDFETFKELREHHKLCWFVDGKVPIEKSVPTAPALPSLPPPAEHSEPPPPSSTPAQKKRFYLCSSCGTYHENWNLFLHIREIHNRHVCLYCIRLFPTAEKLSLHLEIKHDLEQNHFNSEEKLRSVGDGNSRFLMCCTCQHVFSEHERFSDHVCTEYMQPCTLCNQKGRHLSNCKGNPEKRPKVKKKAKPATITTKSTVQLARKAAGTPVPPVGPPPPCDNKHNNAHAIMPTMSSLQPSAASPGLSHPPEQEFAKQNGFTDPQQTESQSQTRTGEYNYHSDDSTNMVIDETCNNNAYVNEMAVVNPFKALDERERLQGEILKTEEPRLTLPPDRVPESIPEPRPLIVPKMKLRVPKEFQKAVESEISSTDSDDDEDEEVDDEPEEPAKEPIASAPQHNNLNMFHARDEDSDNEAGSADDKENTQESDEPNSNLDRILKEIEKTKLDIQRTKEMLEPTNNLRRRASQVDAVPVHQESHSSQAEESFEDSTSQPAKQEVEPEAGQQHATEPQLQPEPEPVPIPEDVPSYTPARRPETEFSWSTPDRDTCSPTPPPTPNSVWLSPLYMSEVSPAVLQAVSERENIENMEKESEQAKEHTSESDKMDTSIELDVETVQSSQEDSAMDVDEKNSTTESRQNSATPTPMDFTPIVSNEMKMTNETPPEAAHLDSGEISNAKLPPTPTDGIEVAGEDTPVVDLLLDRPLEKFETIEFVRLCITAVYTLCLYCNHARRIAVNGHSLVLHLLAQHRFSATVDSITAEELLPSTIVSKLKSFLPDLEEHYLNLKTYCSLPPKETNLIPYDEREFECFQCRFSTKMHKDLYLHNRKMHLKTAILCFMCRSNFFSFSEILCHICPGTPNKVTVFDIKFRCCLCEVDGIPSPFRLMVHLRKKHFACDVCLEDCREQGRLSSHVWKHKLHHLCYRCGIAYRNKMDITKHLFWKHGTESIICKRCLQKRWRHVYHFCVPPPTFVCEVCSLCFSKATYLKVHKRIHTGDFRYPCTEDNCEEKFISRKLLLKHSVIHAPPEIKIEEKQEIVDLSSAQEEGVKEEEPPKEEKPSTESSEANGEAVKQEDAKPEKESEQTSRRKKKKNRNKESLEDLNLIAPNLSESDSSDESDFEKSKMDDKDALVPNVMLSPPSEDDKDEDKADKQVDNDAGKIMDIWQNFKTFQASQQPKQDEDDNENYSESNYPTPILHVAVSDHDYCAMYKVRPRAPPIEEQKPEVRLQMERVDNTSDNERDRHNNSLREKSISPNKKKRKSTGKSSGSSSSDSSSGSDSSCSCGSNCSCSSSGSSSNSSSSSEDSDSSTSEGRRRIAEKKQERADRNRLKSEASPKARASESADIVVEDKEPLVVAAVKENPEPVVLETDLETAESETDEEFYDEHPQKLASEMLAQKRLELRAQMRLSPSHNYDIMENSRPSTPSLPEEVVKEKKVKLKKKKRDRKSTSKSQAVPPIKLNLSVNKVELPSNESMVHQQSMQVPEVDLVPPYDLIASPGIAEPPVAQQPPPAPFLQNVIKHTPFLPSRMSEGSSCSDADNSLKRSKRARRPNKFYGYTSDDENTPGTPLMIGTRTFKPQPPPQLTWRKEDLPTPSKSILLNKQPRSPRTPKTPSGSSGQVKKRVHQKTNAKQKQQKLPPIPTLKIRPSKIGLPVAASALPPPPPPTTNHSYWKSSHDDSDDSDSSDDDLELPPSNVHAPHWNQNATIAKPQIAPPPAPVVEAPHQPTPQASMFNQKIPPALLPNPDFATIQYFKRNNIRYPIRPPAGARQPRDGESVYCYCRCPYDEVSEMIACDGENCLIEWFHFECVGIMVAPQGKWFCAECRPKYSNELYPNM